MNQEEIAEARRRVVPEIDAVLGRWVSGMRRDVEIGFVTEAQVAEGVHGYPDFEDAWDEHLWRRP